MTKQEMLARRAGLRSEFDHLLWRKRRMDERLDALAGEIEQLTAEIIVDTVIEQSAETIRAVPERAVFMEMV